MKRRVKSSALAFAAIVALAGSLQAANPLEDRVPKDAIYYLGWSGADAQQAAYNGSNLKQLVAASTAPQLISEQLPRLMEMSRVLDPNAPNIIAKIQDGMGIAWHHPVAFYFCPVSFDNPQQPPVFRFGLLCDAGTDTDKLVGLLKDATSSIPPDPNFHVSVTIDGNLVGLIFGKQQNAAERQKDGTLSADPAYIKAMSHVKAANPAFAAYFNVKGTVAMANDVLNKMPNIPADDRAKITQVIELLGINQLSQAAAVEGFDGKEWSSQAFLGVSGTPKGLLKLASTTPLSADVLAAVPKNAVAFSASKFDLKATYQEARSFITEMDPPTLQQMDAALDDLSKSTGINLEQDFINTFGDEWVIYRAPLSELGGNNFALVQKLRDPDRLAKTMATLEQMVDRASGGKFKIDHMTESKIEFSTITFLNYSIAWTVRNGYLYISSMEGLPGAVKQVENKLPNITQSDLYTKALAAAGGTNVKPTSIGYSDPSKLYPEIRRTILGILPLARLINVDIPPSILPDPEVVAPFMTPGATITWWDADGMHISGRSAFPGAEIAGGGVGPGTVVAAGALGTAVLLPSLGKARELANRTTDAANLRGLVQSSILYANDHNDKMPDDMGHFVLDGMVGSKQYVNKSSGTTPLIMTPELEQLAKTDYPKFLAQLEEHDDYVYLGKGMTNSMDSTIVIAYDKPGPWLTDGMNLAYADGHAEFVRFAALAQEFRATNEMRSQKGLATVDVDAILRACNAAPSARPMLNNLP